MSKKRTRRELLAGAARGTGAAAGGGALWAYVLRQQAKASPFVLRPPGALAEDDFLSRCIKCGQCVVDCPYGTLRLAAADDPLPLGTPHFLPREVPCYLCPDIPCVAACPTGALDPALTDVAEAAMGVAVIVDQENCLSYRGLRCEICFRACPLQGEAIEIETRPRMLSKHAMFVPVVSSDACTGCGLCEQACPLPRATIKVLPAELARGALGEHYRFGWTGDTPPPEALEPPVPVPPSQKMPPAPGEGGTGVDYLNEGEI